MNIPDFISPIVAWRVWQWAAAGLKSLNGEPWLPSKPLQAGCRVSGCGSPVRSPHAARPSHYAPQFHCSCGIYASKSLDQLWRTQFWQYGSIHGDVSLWGSLVEHEQGFRAEFAYPKALYVTSDMLPVTLKEIQKRIQTLVGYGCDLFIAHNTSTIRLWLKGSGLDAAGLDFLMNRGEEWYARRKDDRTIKIGDRIAVLGHGIAVVEQADDEHVHAVLWNRSVLRIGRSRMTWDEGNRRWEAGISTEIG